MMPFGAVANLLALAPRVVSSILTPVNYLYDLEIIVSDLSEEQYTYT